MPVAVDDFTPTWTPPQDIYQDVCDETTIDAIVEDCFGFASSQTKCDAALAINSACGGCMMTLESAPEHGAIIDYTATRGFYDRNVHGCRAHADGDLSATGCGAKVKAAFDCGVASCAGCLPVATYADIDAINTCVASAAAGPCASYAQEAESCVQAQSGHIAELCPFGNESFTDIAKRYGRLFCGDESGGEGSGGGGAGGSGGGSN